MTNSQQATLGGGCFWCLEAVFSQLRGMQAVVSGYAGGPGGRPDPGPAGLEASGHAEVIQLDFDPNVISYPGLLEVFFSAHDPTTLNRQGADVGRQYRSIILHHSAEQADQARAAIRLLAESRAFAGPIVTELAAFRAFFPADAHHQQYYRANRQQPYCQLVIAPKLARLRQRFPDRIGDQADRPASAQRHAP